MLMSWLRWLCCRHLIPRVVLWPAWRNTWLTWGLPAGSRCCGCTNCSRTTTIWTAPCTTLARMTARTCVLRSRLATEQCFSVSLTTWARVTCQERLVTVTHHFIYGGGSWKRHAMQCINLSDSAWGLTQPFSVGPFMMQHREDQGCCLWMWCCSYS